MKERHGVAFPDADEFMVRELQPDGSYQGAHLDAALSYVTDWRVAIDGGAHVGTWSRTLSQRFERVLAIEPAPDTFEALRENLRRFGCANVEAVEGALGVHSGFGELTIDDANAARANTGGRFINYVGVHKTVTIVAIDDWQLPALGLLKLDIEGAEPLAIQGATATIARCRPIVIYEDKKLWRRYFTANVDPTGQLLRGLHYRELTAAGCDHIWGPA